MTGMSFEALNRCRVCGGGTFAHTPVLWDRLISEWGLSADEARYIDAQQGRRCTACGSNLRSIALAAAVMAVRGFHGLFTDFVRDSAHATLRTLEINEAGSLHPELTRLPGHRLASYPAVDMMALPFAEGEFDLVVHSDTLEHVADPAKALTECRRVLAPDGALVFTVPIVLGRLSRSRLGMPRSYHGAADVEDSMMLVHTEFGADVWTLVLAAGFSSCELVPFGFPAGLALVARR